MKNICILLLLLFSYDLQAQDFTMTDNIKLSEITHDEFVYAYKHRNKIKLHKVGKKTRSEILSNFFKTEPGKDFVMWFGENEKEWYDGEEGIDVRAVESPDKVSKMYVVTVDTPCESQCYLANADNEVDTTTMFYGPEIEFCDGKLYLMSFATNYDCTGCLWCKWYLLEYGNIVQIAELKDESCAFDIAVLKGKMNSVFPDNTGNYYMAIGKNNCDYWATANNDSGALKYYKISLLKR